MLDASEQLQASTLRDAAAVMRAAVAYSTALKNTSDLLRHSLRVERALEDDDRQSLTVFESPAQPLDGTFPLENPSSLQHRRT